MYKLDFKNVMYYTLKDTEKICKPCYTFPSSSSTKHAHAENEIRCPRVNPVLKCFKH